MGDTRSRHRQSTPRDPRTLGGRVFPHLSAGRVLVATMLNVLLGCSTSHDDSRDGAPDAVAMDASRPDAPVELRDGGPRNPDAEPPPGAVVCGGRVCADGEECCLLDATCVARESSACAVPPGSDVPSPCARHSDCAAGDLCEIPDGLNGVACAGFVGSCRRALTPADCGTGFDGVCGCDGRTYADPCAASQAGVRTAARVPCGTALFVGRTMCERPDGCGMHQHCDLESGWCVFEDELIACGIDAQCPEGTFCCGISGLCYDPDRPLSCAIPPEGSILPCADDFDCVRRDRTYWLGGNPRSYCGGPGCGPGGGCMPVPSSCDGVLEPVCGCDGATYTNACEAARARVRVLHEGDCDLPPD